MIVPKSTTTSVAGLVEVFLVPSLTVAFVRAGLGLGWAMFSAVLTLTVLWFAVWLLAKTRATGSPLKIIQKSALLNGAFTVFAPFIPMAHWLNHDVGLSKPLSGFLTLLTFVVTGFVLLVVSALVPRKGEKTETPAPAKTPQEEAPRFTNSDDLFQDLTTFFSDQKRGDAAPK
ncbi:hypothetical protein [Streptomyces sp. NPDC048106]|uniref:hypothetical protein n=1 Tax=Streptomyces sp. NPDC048106 TaxID=3155750 RepID=UPI003456B944